MSIWTCPLKTVAAVKLLILASALRCGLCEVVLFVGRVNDPWLVGSGDGWSSLGQWWLVSVEVGLDGCSVDWQWRSRLLFEVTTDG